MAIQLNLDHVNNNVDDFSFGLLRTNPALSTNAKLVVDSSGNIFMDAFIADQELAKSTYRKYPINSETGSYSYDVAKFFGNLPNDIKYRAAKTASDYAVYTDYANQYEMQYSYGASFIQNKIYKEQYKFFAPIWLDRKLPTQFVIYRVKGTTYSSDFGDSISGQNNRILELLRNATIVKTFDLTEKSGIGRYLRNHISDQRFPVAPISQNYGAGQFTVFRGIDVVKGGFVEKKESLHEDFIQFDNLEIFNNELFSNGFKRNEIASANLINLEFLFDDIYADNYDIYRYFGVYVIPHEEGEFDIDRTINNENREGVFVAKDSESTYFNLTGTSLSNNDMLPKFSELRLPSLNWIRSKDGDFYHIRNNELFTENDFLPVSLNGQPESEFTGSVLIDTLQLEDFSINLKDFLKIKIVASPINGDKIFIAPFSELSANNFVVTPFIIAAENSLPAGKFTNNKFSINGTLEEITRALAGCLSQSEYRFKIKYDGSTIILEDYAVGSNRKMTIFGIRTGNISDFLLVENGSLEVPTNLTSSITSNWDIYYPVGGSLKNQSVIVKSENKGSIQVGDLVKSALGDRFVKIKQIIEDPYTSGLWRIIFEKEIELTRSRNLNIYRSYKTKYGRFQVLDIKDFDFDFYDTSNSELNELALETSLTSQQYNKYDLSCTSDFLIEPAKYYSNLTPINKEDVINKQAFVNDLDEDGATEIFGETISSEYNRLSENEIKDTAILSRVVPTINKFVLKDGFNARMKPYYLSVNESFGSDNLSPSLSGDTRRPDLLNMEHFHINRMPLFLQADIENLYKNKSYIDLGIGRNLSVTDLKSTSYNYFDKYLIWNGLLSNFIILKNITKVSLPGNVTQTIYEFNGPISSVPLSIPANTQILRAGSEPVIFNAVSNSVAGSNKLITTGTPIDPALDFKIGDIINRNIDSNNAPIPTYVKNKREIRYSRFSNGNANQYPSTIFRGLRYSFKNRKETSLSTPKEFIQTGEVNGYKFGFVVNATVSNNATDSTTRTIEVVKNDKFRFICIYVNLILQNNLVRSFPRKVFYEIENALSAANGLPVDTIIDGGLDLNGANWLNFGSQNSGLTYVKGIVGANGKSPRFLTQLNQVDGQYSYLIVNIGNTNKVLKVDRVVGDDAIIVKGWPRDWDGINGDLEAGVQWTTVGSISSTLEQSLSYKYYKGGTGVMIEVFESLNAKRFSDLVNNNPSQITYTTVKEDGTITNNEYVLEIEDGTEFIKLSSLSTEVDSDKPKSYKVTAEEIGKNIIKRSDEYFVAMKRMNGDYLPKFNDVLFFEELYPFGMYYELNNSGQPIKTKQSILYNKYNNIGVVFGTAYTLTGASTIGYIPNYHYHKVNTESADAVLKLSVTSDKLPVYPKIGEIAIDKKNLNILKSKYEDDYYSKSLLNNRSEPAFGTINPAEKSSFMASTVMKVSDDYTLSAFNAVKLNSLDELDSFSIKASRNSSIGFFETEDKVYVDVYLKYAVLDELIEKGVKSKFNKYVDPAKSYGDITTIEDDLSRYVELNIVPRFIIESVDLYAREGKDIQTAFISINDVSEIDQTVFVKQSNFTYRTFTEDRLGFRLIYNKRPGYLYNFIPVIKIFA